MTTIDEALDQQARPEGQPGTVHRHHHAWSYPAVRLPDGRTAYWRDTETSASRWLIAPPGLAASFEAGPDWQEHCPHENGVPWRPCDSETDCVALKREEGAWFE